MKIMGELYKENWKPFVMNLYNNPFPGKFISFEGVDGVGKTTLLDLTASFLRKKGIKVETTYTPSAEIRNLSYWKAYGDANSDRSDFDPFGLDLVAFGDRLVWQNRFLIPLLQQGTWVLCDRHILNSLVYNQHACFLNLLNYVLKPDLGFVITVDIGTSVSRVRKRGEVETNEMIMEKQIMSERYLLMAKKYNYIIVDTTQNTPDQSFETIEKSLDMLI